LESIAQYWKLKKEYKPLHRLKEIGVSRVEGGYENEDTVVFELDNTDDWDNLGNEIIGLIDVDGDEYLGATGAFLNPIDLLAEWLLTVGDNDIVFSPSIQ
jgi:hypothetical protein